MNPLAFELEFQQPLIISVVFAGVCVIHLTAPEVLAQLPALTTIAEATETPGSV